ncbi:MAG: hypothetical protein ACM31C_06525, partial [Acidobacteriota bacterium]
DGYVGGERQILEVLLRKLPRSCRLHVLGVGSAVNRSLATALARAGRGVEVIVGVDEDAERGAKRLLDRTRMPIVTNLELAGSALVRHAPEQLPDVFEGAPLVAAVELRPDGGELVVRGQLARDTWEQRIRVPARAAGEGNQAIVALYGRERVADVEAHGMFDTVDGEIEDLGLEFQIATRMTSWIAIDESRIVKGPTREQVIPQELPYGTSAKAFGLRAPARVQMDVGEAMLSHDAELDFAEEAPTGEALAQEAFADELAGFSDILEARAPSAPQTRSRSSVVLGGGPSGGAPRRLPSEAPAPPPASPAPPPASPAPQRLQEEAKVAPAPLPEPMPAKPLPVTRARTPWWLALVVLAILAALIAWWLLA